jgi:hypothetical protein
LKDGEITQSHHLYHQRRSKDDHDDEGEHDHDDEKEPFGRNEFLTLRSEES